jgi:hypothetical protein
MATKMPHSKRSWYQCGCWFTLVDPAKCSSKNELTVQSNSLGGINIMVYQGNAFMKGMLTLTVTPLPPRRRRTGHNQTSNIIYIDIDKIAICKYLRTQDATIFADKTKVL